jgi:drug/metabolite transporter (DMT)-like permease
MVARRKGGLPPIALNSAQMLLGGVVLLMLAWPFEGPPRLVLPVAFYGQLLWLAIISAAAFAIWFHLLSQVRVSRLNIWKFLIPLGGAVLSWLLVPGERPNVGSVSGMLLIVAGVVAGQTGPGSATRENAGQ